MASGQANQDASHPSGPRLTSINTDLTSYTDPVPNVSAAAESQLSRPGTFPPDHAIFSTIGDQFEDIDESQSEEEVYTLGPEKPHTFLKRISRNGPKRIIEYVSLVQCLCVASYDKICPVLGMRLTYFI